jgi:ABC-type nitrate/sulfonate/bicarbonate transport system substrate-binding protein
VLPVHVVDVGGAHELVTVEFMRRQGFFERMGLLATRTFVKNGGEAKDLLLAGQGDVAMQVGFGPALMAIEGGAPLRIIAASNLLTVHALYSRQPDIRRLRDLQHRTVGVGAPGALTHQLVFAALTKHGIDPATVRFVDIGNSARIFRALLAGEVDAGFGETDVFEHQAQYGVHALEDGVLWRELPEFPNQASFATEAAIRGKREVIVRTLAAHALLYRSLHDTEARDVYAASWAAALPESHAEQCRAQWQFYQDYHPFAEDLMLPETQLDYLQELNVSMKVQRRVLPFAEVVDLSLAREALRLIEEDAAHRNQEQSHV